mmetsp:Transcript_31434/g.79786  ORF Transcript_31434/g.79786 Transcript_31434/m.79786 type:complete len:215 (-) Transcript_31434:1519-2163(-)
MAPHHMQRPLAARDTRPTTSGLKSSMAMYFARALSLFGSMLSLSKLSSCSIKSPSPRSFLLASQSGFLPSSTHTASIVVCTKGGGLAKDLTSVMSPLVSELRAETAALRAGSASSRSFWASSWMMRTPAANSSTSAASLDTTTSTLLASSLSMATCLSSTSVLALFSLSTGSSTARSSLALAMTVVTSAILARPLRKRSLWSDSSSLRSARSLM